MPSLRAPLATRHSKEPRRHTLVIRRFRPHGVIRPPGMAHYAIASLLAAPTWNDPADLSWPTEGR
jgi:hypothetical protein